MSSPYWPSLAEINLCIRTEAEELADATVLAVHEPMMFRRVAAREAKGELISESELLKHVIESTRPTPIIGESGFGKSHVIRWVDLQLRRQNRSDWHIVRIGKNASLRQALMTLLSGLEGPEFAEARRRIDTIGNTLSERQVAEHLIVFVGARLGELFEEAQRQREQWANDDLGARAVDAEARKRNGLISRHARPEGLRSLLGDPNFKRRIIGEGKCFFQIAKRLTKGSSDEEIQEQTTSVTAADLEITEDVGNLSLEARNYVRNARLNTEETARTEAAQLLNECLGDASRAAFQQLFQFHGGSFQDLFQDLRCQLLKNEKHLFVLVEDMAAISAIEDVLIDSLMQEETRGGKQVLCPLHSAIAVTTGYDGYRRRQSTISTRAGYEWNIERSDASEEKTFSRIYDFCGRYLNAARHGEEQLTRTFDNSISDAQWPGLWQSGDKHDRDTARAFGFSPANFPLFPYTPNALRALSLKYCSPSGKLEFNPRKILKHILREPLKEFRSLYEDGRFPPEDFARIGCPGNLQLELRREVRDDIGRVETFAAIWGHPSESLAQLAHVVPTEVAREFGMASLAAVLDRVEKRQPPRGDRGALLPPPPVAEDVKDKKLPLPILGDQALVIPREVDDYFKNRSIPQAVANSIRTALLEAIDSRSDDFKAWYGLKDLPTLKSGQRILIRVPYNANNPPGAILNFGKDSDFSDRLRSLKYNAFIVAILRRARAAEAERRSWSYPKGAEDYCHYLNFLDEWLPPAMEVLADEARKGATKVLEGQLPAAILFDTQFPKKSAPEKLDVLVRTADALTSSIRTTTGLGAWDNFFKEQLAQWERDQTSWLGAFSATRRGIEGDLVVKAIRGKVDLLVPANAQRAARNASQEFSAAHAALEILEGCSTLADYQGAIKRLQGLLDRLMSNGQFRGVEGIVNGKSITGKKYKEEIASLLEDDTWESVQSALALRRPFEATAVIKALQRLDIAVAGRVNNVLSVWGLYYLANLQRMRNENEERGASHVKQLESAVEKAISEIQSAIGVAEEWAR
jgi:hypothetical protein